MLKDKIEVGNFVYSSYLRAHDNIPAGLPDSKTRNPQYTKILLDKVGNPDVGQKNIMITGSKGKGSVSRMVSKLIEAHGNKVGLFTSPHLINFNERIRINGIAISDEALVDYANRIYPHFMEIEKGLADDVYIGPVGVSAVIAMMYFKEENTDFNVVECGKGALYDDVAMVSSQYSVINSVFLEHIPQLGSNITEIAENKAGVIKETHSHVFTAKQQPEVERVIKEVAAGKGAEFVSYEDHFRCSNISISKSGTKFDVVTRKGSYKGLEVKLLGRHQAHNAALAISVVEEVLLSVDPVIVMETLKNITWPGRLEIINESPLVIVDGCINRQSSKYVREIMDEINEVPLVLIMGIPDDKDYYGVCDEFKDIAEKIIFTRTRNQYLKFTDAQIEKAKVDIGEKFIFEEYVDSAIDKAYEILGSKGTVLILGTQSLIADTNAYYGKDITNLD